MDVGHSNGWRLDEVVPARDLIATVTGQWPAAPIDPGYRGEVAARWRYLDGAGEFGIISSVTMPFCRDCTRARLSADGKLYTCLFAVDGRDVRAVLRDGSTDEQAAGLPDCDLARPRRPLLRAAGAVHTLAATRPAQGRDVRDGWLRPVVHRVIHSVDKVVDSAATRSARFVDKRVDPVRGRRVA